MGSLTPDVVIVGEVLLAVVLVACLLLGRRIDARLGSVVFQLGRNGGATLRDAVDRIEQRLGLLEQRTQVLEDHDSWGEQSSGG